MNIRKLTAFYFKPKSFEICNEKIIYEWIGITAYKKYLPTTGDIARKKRGIIQIKIGKGDKAEELYRCERKTRNYEWRHIMGAIIFILLTGQLDRKLNIFDWVFLPLLNLYINIYPVFLQRYNRMRIIKILRSNGYPSPYDI